MKRGYSRLFHIIIFLLIYKLSIGESFESNSSNPWFFKKITTIDGLSQSSVNCFFEDELGFIWVGTDDGLNRYDGNSFEVFGLKKGGDEGLSNSTVLDLTSDSSGNIWIGTASGLNQYNISEEVFTQYLDTTINNFYSKLLIDSANQRIWLAANAGGLKYFDLRTSMLMEFPAFKYPESLVREITRLSDHELLVGSLRSGIFLLNTDVMEIIPYLNDTTASRIRLPSNMVRKIIKSGDELIIGIQGQGICYYNFKNNRHRFINKENSSLSSNQSYSMCLDTENSLLVGTDGGGLNYIDNTIDQVISFKQEEANVRSLSSDVIRSVFKDSDGNIWIGTYNGGINLVNRLSKNVQYFGKNIQNENSLSHKNVTSFIDSDEGGVWIGTDGGGLNYLKDGKYKTIKSGNSTTSLNDDVIMCLNKSLDEELLIGTFRGGLNVFKNGIIEKYVNNTNDSSSISDNWIWSIKVDKKGNYWIGTNDGLNKFDPKTRKFKKFKPVNQFTYMYSINNIRSLLIDHEDNLWIGSFGGLGKFNLNSEEFEYFLASSEKEGELKNDIIVKIFEDSEDNLWIGTYGGGLSRFNKEKKTFKTYEKKDGLPSNHIQSIEEDEHGNLWISTIKGLVKFNIENESFQVLDESYGLQSDVFKHNSSLKIKNGNMLFGGINGFNMFHPDSIRFPQISAKVILTDFQVFNKSVKPNDEKGILQKSIVYSDEISLSYDDSRFFEIHFTSPNYSFPDRLKFAYKLEGFDEQWNYIDEERKVTFTNLSPASYTLKLKVSSSNIWPEEFSRVELNIIPPFYLRKSFIVFLIVLVIVLTIGFYKYRSHRFRVRERVLEKLVDEKNTEITIQNNELTNRNTELTQTQKELKLVNNTLEEKVKKRTEKLKITVDKLNKSVSELDRFVYSASHDLSAPLKSIQGLVNIARIERDGQNLSVHLDYIENSIHKLESVIKDLIQFSRNSRSELKFSEINLYSLISGIINLLKFLPGYDKLKFEIDISENEIIISDFQRIQMVLENLLSNAIKYQDDKKPERFVWIKYRKTKANWHMEIRDNGIGISKEHVNGVFDMFYRATELSYGSGLGLFIVKEATEKLKGHVQLESVEKHGSSFLLSFPINQRS